MSHYSFMGRAIIDYAIKEYHWQEHVIPWEYNKYHFCSEECFHNWIRSGHQGDKIPFHGRSAHVIDFRKESNLRGD